MERPDGRGPAELRPIRITRNYLSFAEGSALIELGETRVICSASVVRSLPSFLHGAGLGWVTAEYGMLPRSTQNRTVRDAVRGRIGGRTHEIQRLIGRSLRSVVDLSKLGERTIFVDCDVLQADGGTRTASITGAFVALHDAIDRLRNQGEVESDLLRGFVAGVSVGVVEGTPLLDLSYAEDSSADVDMNVVMTGSGKIVEVQGTAERRPFSLNSLLEMLRLAKSGIFALIDHQRRALGVQSSAGSSINPSMISMARLSAETQRGS